MSFDLFEVSTPHIVYACLGGFIVLFGMFSLLLREKLYVGEACWAFLFGVVIGPYAANIFDPHSLGGHDEEITNVITLEVTRVVLAIGVFAIGVELPKAYIQKHWRSLAFLLVPVMTWGWFICAGLIYALIPGLNFLSSLAVAACLTPTDPILAAAVVGGKYADKHVPAHIRHLLAAESGCNDGAAFPFLYIALYLTIDKSTSHAIQDWFVLLWLYQVILGAVIGAVIGFAFRHLMKFCERHNLIDRHSYVAQYISLAMLVIGVTTLLGSDDLLAAFTCGTAFAWDGFFNRQTEESVFSSVIDLLFNVAAFVYVGAWMPFSSFADSAGGDDLGGLNVWRLVVLAICILLLRRLPIVCLLFRWIPDIKTWREAVFCGHFGPIGIGGVFISTLAAEVLQKARIKAEATDPGFHSPHQAELLMNTIQPIVAFMVLCSITIHGLSIPSFSLGRRVHSVSRTWSRHTTFPNGASGSGQPEWAGQARFVRGGEEIVINRDREDLQAQRDLEKGDVHAEVDGNVGTPGEDLESSQTQVGADGSKNGGSQERLADAKEKEKAKMDGSETPEGDNPPDGTDIIAEWQEGKDRIIERRAGPGEEVEVEVIRNAHSPTQESVSTSFATAHPHISAAMDQFQSHHSIESRHAHHPNPLGAILEKEVRAVEAKAEKLVHSGAGGSTATREYDGHENEEEWASDRSEDETQPEETAGRTRSKSPKTKSGAAASGSSRRRNSVRKHGVLGFMRSARSHPPTAGTPSEQPPLADRHSHVRDFATETQGKHRRVHSLKLATPLHSARVSRDSSPSRPQSSGGNVRFADEQPGPSGAHTPKQMDATGDGNDTPTKVTFDLP